MARAQRHQAILDHLTEHGRLDIDAAATQFEVSAATIRRDLDVLAEQQLVRRTRGGAVARTVSYELPLRHKAGRRAAEKQSIAQAASRLVTTGSAIGLNGGTTTTELARELAVRADLNADRSDAITVVTNALNIATELTVRRHVKLIVTGGTTRPQSQELVGSVARTTLEFVNLDIAFIGVDAVSPTGGAMAHNEQEARVNSALLSRARRTVIVADASKLGVRAAARICGIGKIDTLITDGSADPEMVRRFEEAGVETIVA